MLEVHQGTNQDSTKGQTVHLLSMSTEGSLLSLFCACPVLQGHL